MEINKLHITMPNGCEIDDMLNDEQMFERATALTFLDGENINIIAVKSLAKGYLKLQNDLVAAMCPAVPDDAVELGRQVSRNALLVAGGHITVEEADTRNAALITEWASKREDAALKRALESWHNIMALVPMGQEDAVAGASTYNWMRRARDHFVSFLNPVSEIAHKKENRKNES